MRWWFTYWSRHGVPGPNFMEYELFYSIHHHYILKAVQKYGRIYGTYLGTGRSLVVNEPDLIRDIMVKDFRVFADHKHIHNGSTKIAKDLYLMHGNDDWKRVRSAVTPAFTSSKMRAMMDSIGDIFDTFCDNLRKFQTKGETIDIREYMGALTMDVICRCAYGINPESIHNPNHPIVTNAKKILTVDASMNMVTSVLAPGLAKMLNLELFDKNALTYFDKLTNQILTQRKTINNIADKYSEMADNDIGYHSLSDGERDVSPESMSKRPTSQLTPDEMTAQGVSFFIGGYNSTSTALTHAIYYLSLHPECQQKLYSELKTCDEYTYETLGLLKYLNAVINETLRLAPSLTRIQRECLMDYKLGNTGITIPKGTCVEIYPYTLHRDPDYWPNPNDFLPDRWFESTHHPYAYVPFGGGPRQCIGQRFAITEMQMCLAKLIRKFEFSLAQTSKLDYFVCNALMSPKKLLVQLALRS
ncbi:unnamed protein product [Oppiella nova]|uniref:Cytochrome P450 n=1 Tax=Oppiella nova TaxID=334625 RepID=A0A7R9LNF4_9ACAR|nr:unnamed protein product [Oppiella nova]CAG2165362.1 unnamed protein product [Oppiella nova]